MNTDHIEAMCITCHGPLPRKTRRGNQYQAVRYCHENCRAYWKHYIANGKPNGKPIGGRYELLRMDHAYRREKLAFLLHIEHLLLDTSQHEIERIKIESDRRYTESITHARKPMRAPNKRKVAQ